jgi:non-specific serine/threonine protein kinase/serine/threonine-protein kinase
METDPTMRVVSHDLSPKNQPHPESVGDYRILRVIGEGGMGTVFLAEQANPRRQVALKVLRPGLASQNGLRRFELESQVLGLLHHQGIAQIYEAGTADEGAGPQPFFAMEYIDGKTLLDWTAGADQRAIVALVAEVCDAVHHAHQKGVIHRDLKPDNVLVDCHGQPKVLDFGIARLVTDSDEDRTMLTEQGHVAGTLAYMSPEQFTADPHLLDPRSDIYTLGIILYEALCGQRPFDIRGLAFPDVSRMVLDTDPPRLGTRNHSLRGDLDTMVHKALDRDRDRRYTSAAGFSADLRRYLEDEPILARPPSSWYQLRMLAKRHRTLCGSLVTLLVVIIAAATISLRMAMRATAAERLAVERLADAVEAEQIAEKEKRDAQRSSRRAETVLGFLDEMLTNANPEITERQDVSVRDVLEEMRRRLDAGEFADDEQIELPIRRTLGSTYLGLGFYPESEVQLRRALELADRNDWDPLERAAIQRKYGRVQVYLERLDEARQVTEAALATHLDAYGEHHPEVSQDLSVLASIAYRGGDIRTAIELAGRSLEAQRRGPEPDPSSVVAALRYLGFLYAQDREIEQADEYLRQALGLAEEAGLTGTARHATLLLDRADLRQLQRRFAEAESLLKHALIIRREIFSNRHPYVASVLHTLGYNYHLSNQAALAIEPLREAISIRRETLGKSADLATSLSVLSQAIVSMGEREEALQLAEEALDMRLELFGEVHPAVGASLATLGRHFETEDPELALEYNDRAADVWLETIGEKPEVGRVLLILGRVQRRLGLFEDSEESIRHADEILQDEHVGQVMEVRFEMGETLLDAGSFEAALDWADETLERFRSTLSEGHPFREAVLIQRGRALAGLDRCEECRAEFLASVQAVRANAALLQESRDLAARRAAEFFATCGPPEEALRWCRIVAGDQD